MQAQTFFSRSGDGPLWLAALGMSLLLNLVLMAVLGFTMLETAVFRKEVTVAAEKPQQESVATIIAEVIQSRPTVAAAVEPSAERRFARTSDDQISAPAEAPTFMGERNTRATSERAPDPTAPPLPSQAGIDRNDLETTVSRYQDGSLTTNPSPPSEPADAAQGTPMPETQAATEPSPIAPPTQPVETTRFGEDATRSSPPPMEKLLTGPNPVDVPVPRPAPEEDVLKPTPEQRPAPPATPKTAGSEIKPTAKPAKPAINDPAFRGNQRKSAIVGSISRTGRSALDVEDTPLGRYESAISRAVEQEWQRNCVRHRDFITPGYLTVRFYVEASGKVKSVEFVGDMETGEVQKGFTLNSIRDADIPAMPPAVRKDFSKDPLELIFRFYF